MWARCEICGRMVYCDVHHVFMGTRLKIAERLGLTVTLCQRCHDDVHAHPKKYDWLKAKAQRDYQTRTGISTQDFIEIMGRSYID